MPSLRLTSPIAIAVVASVTTLSLLAGRCDAVGPEPQLLWPDGAPGAVGDEDVDRPLIRVYRPEGPANGAAVVIFPGGGYGALATDHEGHQFAKWFNRFGVTAAVVRYRLGRRYQHPAPLQDAQRAVRYMRHHANEFGIDPHRIGVMGFSAGGHLASTVSTHYDDGDESSDDPLERLSCRPDFTILGYPVISLMSDFGHKGSARNLLGDDPDPELLKSLSNETQVTEDTPPAFLFHTTEDRGVPVQNSLVYYRALVEHGVPAELHAYQNGPHGVGLGIGDPVLYSWKDRLQDWMQTSGFLTDVERAAVSGKITENGKPVSRGTITLIPLDDPENRPIAWGRIGRGNYTIPADRGPTIGMHKIVIRDLGTVVPEPTIEDIRELTAGKEYHIEIVAGDNANVFTIDLPAAE
ncbi:MAG: alpha/beta hydrolase [Maioricimonas sp. JB045]